MIPGKNIDFHMLTTLICEKCSAGRLLLIRGGTSFVHCGAEKLLTPLFSENSVSVTEFSDFSVNPKKEDVDRGVVVLRSCQPHMMLAVGGGSVLDMAKLIRHYARMSEIPLVAIPTTSGTGAEATSFAVCYIDGVKCSICADDIMPDYAVLLPELTMQNDNYLTACTGFDALAQAIEAYWNVNATAESDQYALEAVSLIFKSLLCENKSLEERTALMRGAHLAGRAINITKTTAPHAMSYTFTSRFGYPHGHAVALTFPFFFERNWNCSRDQFAGADYDSFLVKKAHMLSLLGWYDKNLQMQMKQYISQLNLGYDPVRQFVDEEVAKGINLERAKNNPLRLNDEIIKEAVASIRK